MTSGGTVNLKRIISAVALAVFLSGQPTGTAGAAEAGAVDPEPAGDTLLGFAQWLCDEEDYYRAITEYKRWLYLHPRSPDVPRIRLRIAEIYLQAGKPDAARIHLREIREEYRGTAIGRAAALLLAGSYHAQREYRKAATELARFLADYPGAPETDQARLMRALCLWQSGRPDQAQTELARVPADSPARPQADAMLSAMPAYRRLPLKSPLMAGALSTILPGAGQVYVGYYSDAAISFLLNGLLIWAAWEAFDNDEYVTGGLLCAVELGWYLGNVYNAVNDAHKFNRRLKRRFFRDLRLEITPLTGAGGGPAGAALGVSLNF